jgi:hypothetical protein
MASGKRGKGAYVTAEGLDGIRNAAAHLRGEGLVESKRHHLEALRPWLDLWVSPGLDRVLRDAGREPPQSRKKAVDEDR